MLANRKKVFKSQRIQIINYLICRDSISKKAVITTGSYEPGLLRYADCFIYLLFISMIFIKNNYFNNTLVGSTCLSKNRLSRSREFITRHSHYIKLYEQTRVVLYTKEHFLKIFCYNKV